jgi:hypothetical protein
VRSVACGGCVGSGGFAVGTSMDVFDSEVAVVSTVTAVSVNTTFPGLQASNIKIRQNKNTETRRFIVLLHLFSK